MLLEFTKDIEEIYAEIIKNENPSLDLFKEKWGIEGSMGEAYQNLVKKEHKRETGSFYTPKEVVDYIIKDIFKDIDYKQNPYIRILDPSCGGGYFLTAAYSELLGLAREAGMAEPEKHVIGNNIHGFDIDPIAVMITTIELYGLSGQVPCNITCGDYLLNKCQSFDIIAGNPPYMGHKVINPEYRAVLQKDFKEVFSDKGDIAYCFIKKSIDCLPTGGILMFFTSRYMLEALNGEDIRSYIQDNTGISGIIDFYGVRIIKGVGVDNIIIKLEKGQKKEQLDYFRVKENAKGLGQKVFDDIKNTEGKLAKHIVINSSSLKKSGWTFLDKIEEEIIDKIRGAELSNYCDSYQGIITGCDDAFVLKSETAAELEIEKELLKSWIKNGNIKSFNIEQPEEVLIYSDVIKDMGKYKNAIRQIQCFRERLEKRRECAKGLRRWYELQWGRNPEIFEGRKIVFPYKASSNRFAIDSGSYFSADVYCIKLKDMFDGILNYEYLAGLLNSSIYEFYIKTMAKKLGEDMYEYYPNKIMTLRILPYIKDIEKEVLMGGENLRYRIDMILINYLGITIDEYSAIRSWCS